MKEMRLRADGITCSSCAADMENILAGKDGILHVSVNFIEDSVVIQYDPDILDRREVYTAVRRLGYPLKIVSET
jgi:Cu+-exporting ATPase